MKNYISPGDHLTIRNSPIEAKSGDLVLIEEIAGVAVTDAEEEGDLVIATRGVFYLPKVLQENVSRFTHLSYSEDGLTTDTSSGKIVALAIEDASNGQSHVAARLLDVVLPQSETDPEPVEEEP